jgi:dolichol-phosphate mannosyltransferase
MPLGSNLDIAVVLPTFNERGNVQEIIRRLSIALEGLNWELYFVDDDSPDGTSDVVRTFAAADHRIHLIQRIGRRGLSSACIEGMLACSASAIAVMDADMQHDESILRRMLEKLRVEDLDIVVATRNAAGGSMGEFGPMRVFISRLGQRFSRAVTHCVLTDPMSGFFVVRRSFFLEVVRRLYGGGFKILVDMLASATRPVKLGEVGYTFRTRQVGESKLDLNVSIEYLILVVNKLTHGVAAASLVLFALVGTFGVAVHFAFLSVLYFGAHLSFGAAQTWATFAAMTSNFFLNNLITFRDRSLRGSYLFFGWLSFCLACSFGAWVNVSFAETLLHSGMPWYVAGFGGMVLSASWNYSISNLFTWRMPQSRRLTAAAPQTSSPSDSVPSGAKTL